MVTQRPISPASRHADDGEATLWVELAVDVAQNADCPLGERVEPTESGSVQLVDSQCHITLSSTDESGTEVTRTITTEISEECACRSFCRAGCVPELIGVEGGSLRIGGYANSRETLAEAMKDLRSTAADVRLKRLTTASNEEAHESSGQVIPEGISLTEKQREAVAAAVKMGYYETPRTASLEDLSDKLGVTRSAMSQRLNAVESKLIVALASGL